MHFIYVFDLLGTFAFAVSGALLGVRKDMDIYGLFVLAFVVAAGGGTVREIVLGSLPPFVFTDPNYLYVTVVAVFLVMFFHKKVESRMRYFIIMDAVGLGVFTVIGASKAINAELAWFGVLLIAILTSTGGGMIRDVLAGEIPFVLRKEVYASASLAGDNPYFSVSDIETVNPAKSFTIDTLIELDKRYDGQAEFYFIVGTDAVGEIPSWERAQGLLKYCVFVAATRPGFATAADKALDFFGAEGKSRIIQLDTPELEISSTDIRARVKAGRSFKYIVPASVELYIKKEGLYSPVYKAVLK